MRKRRTLAEFEALHPDKLWTRGAQETLKAGEKRCTKCSKVRDVEEFGFLVNVHGKKRVRSCCLRCKSGLKDPSPFNRKMQECADVILSSDLCDVCDQPGADYFYRNTRNGAFGNWAVFHKRCAKKAKSSGLIPFRGWVRCKSELRGGK